MKENNGIARRRQLKQRLLIAFASSVSFFLGSHVYRILHLHTEQTHVDLQVKEWIADPLDAFMNDVLPLDFDADTRGRIRQILSASANLINIGSESDASVEDHSYSGIIAEFCPLNFTLQKNSPSQYPMFEDVVESSHCGKGSENILRVDLYEAVQLARKFDVYVAKNYDKLINSNYHPTVLDLKGVVFHESRCGSTLAASSMVAVNPSKHRVYSESGPPESAMKACGEGYPECSVNAAANLMNDVVYMISRTNDPEEENLFFVFQPESTRTMETFRTAFPTTPWIFLYRPPIGAMNSQGKDPAFSLNPSPMVKAFVKKEKYRMEDMTINQVYAIQMATFCLSALRNFHDAAGLGLAVKYTNEFDFDLIDTILPKHFHSPVDRDGKKRVSAVYDEVLRTRNKNELAPGPPRGDDEDIDASQVTKDAVKQFLQKSYNKLEEIMYNIKKCRQFMHSGVVLLCEDQYNN